MWQDFDFTTDNKPELQIFISPQIRWNEGFRPKRSFCGPPITCLSSSFSIPQIQVHDCIKRALPNSETGKGRLLVRALKSCVLTVHDNRRRRDVSATTAIWFCFFNLAQPYFPSALILLLGFVFYFRVVLIDFIGFNIEI